MEKDCQLLSTARALKLADRKILARKGLWLRRAKYKRLGLRSILMILVYFILELQIVFRLHNSNYVAKKLYILLNNELITGFFSR